MKAQLEALLVFAESRMDDEPPESLTGGYEQRGDEVQDPFLANILAFSLLATLTGEDRHVAAAKRWALGLARMPEWVGLISPEGECASCGYPEGWAATALAVAHDWLQPHLDGAEQVLLRDKVALLAKVLHQGALRGEWWTGAYLHHDTWIPLGGMGLAAMAVVDEVPEARAFADRAAAELGRAIGWLGEDGAWPEGPCGWAFAMISAVPFWEAYVRRFPERAGEILDEPWIRRGWEFRLQSRTPDGRFLGFGDCNPHGGYQENAKEAAPTLRWMAARFREPHAQWLAAREWEKVPNPFTAAWEIVFADPSVPEVSPEDLTRMARFDDQAMAFLRTGWDEAATVVAFRAVGLLGRHANAQYRPGEEAEFNNSTTHTHADGGSFAVWSRGAFAITMARYGQRETAFQNSLLVDGRGQYASFGPSHVGRPDGRITALFRSPQGSVVEGDATRCYPPGLRRYLRRICLVEPGLVFLCDDVAAERPVSLEWRLHVDNGASLSVSEPSFTSTLAGRVTVARLAAPSPLRFVEASDEWNRAVAARLPERVEGAALMAVIVPSLPAGERARIATPSPGAFTVETLGSKVHGCMCTALEAALSLRDELEGRGTAAFTTEGPTPGFLAVEATRLYRGGKLLLEASGPVTASFARRGDRGQLMVAAKEPTEVVIETGLSGASLRAGAGAGVGTAGSRVEARLSAGVTELEIVARG